MHVLLKSMGLWKRSIYWVRTTVNGRNPPDYADYSFLMKGHGIPGHAVCWWYRWGAYCMWTIPVKFPSGALNSLRKLKLCQHTRGKTREKKSCIQQVCQDGEEGILRQPHSISSQSFKTMKQAEYRSKPVYESEFDSECECDDKSTPPAPTSTLASSEEPNVLDWKKIAAKKTKWTMLKQAPDTT